MKRILSLALAVILALSALTAIPAFASNAWDGSSKSEPAQVDGVYQIGNGAELAWFAEKTQTQGNVSAVLTNDIDLGGKEWSPIGSPASGYAAEAYSGTFDGQNHSVSNLKIDTSKTFRGLFNLVYGGTVKNLKVSGDVNTSGNTAGGIVGKLQGGTIENCSFEGSLTAGKNYGGGIVGNIVSGKTASSVIACCNKASVNAPYAGGILGYTTAKAEIKACYNTGEITGKTREAGIVGQQTTGTISYCYNLANTSCGIYGFSNATINNCYYLGEAGTPGGRAKPTNFEQITSNNKSELLTKLNSGEEKYFVADSAKINDGYPVFEWQIPTQKSVPVTKAEIEGDTITGAQLSAKALGEDGKDATDVKYQWSISDDNKNFSDLADANKSAFAIPDTAEYAGKYIKVSITGEENSSAFDIVGPIKKSDALVEKENSQKVQSALDSLTLDKTVIKSAETLALPSEKDGCDIKWSSSDENIISNEGVVTLPDKNIKTVVLTASVTYGSVTKTKDFKINVWSNNIDPDVYLKTAADEIDKNFNVLQPKYGEDSNIIVKFQNILKSKGFDGITVTVKSTSDEKLISENGKIYYPLNTSDSFADGKQVQVIFNLTLDNKSISYPDDNVRSLLVPWDTSNVKKSLEKSADNELKESTLCQNGDTLSSVSSNLILPSCVKGDKYSFAWIKWTTSDENHLAISDENRQGTADALYNPYVGKVYRDAQEHEVVLKATLTNPSTGITATRTFNVTVNPMSDEELNQNLSSMQSILDCYTADKLKNFETKKQLDTAAVDSDIQLVIPKNVVTKAELEKLNYGKYWDYWNYKFTVSSSDNSVISVNSFRAYVYRPLGEDSSADKIVTLRVKMQSKKNPNLFVTKDIPLTVKHLSRADINNALDLMDKAKDGYTKGILGNNADEYSVIDSLSPFVEVVWNADKSGIDYIYSTSESKNNGIAVDELPGWEDQEDWRLFKTSDKDLISNETLNLNKTPDSDTFVKINSVLTDETLGKYYEKFKDDKNYDAEALAKFKQLYKQPVSAYVMVVGAGNYTQTFAAQPAVLKASAYSAKLSAFKKDLDKPISVTFTILGLDGRTMVAKTKETSFTKGSTVFDVFKKVTSDNNIKYTAKGSYISSINGLAEREYGNNSGWMYTVGNVFVNSYMNAQELSGGEDIVVMYVRDYLLANKMHNNSGDDDNGKKTNTNNSNGNAKGNSSKSAKNGKNSSKSKNSGASKGKNTNSANAKASANNSKSTSGGTVNGTSSSSGTSAGSTNGGTATSNTGANSQDKNKAAKDATVSESSTPETNSSNTSGSNTENETVVNGTGSKTTAEKKSNKTPVIIACIAAAIILALIIILLILKKRKKDKE